MRSGLRFARSARCPETLVLSAVLLTAIAAPGPAVAGPGDPDPTFSDDGRTTVTFPGLSTFAQSVAVAPDGALFVAGTTGSGDDDFVVAKLLNSGALDLSFGTLGKAVVAFDLGGSKDDQLEKVVRLADGKLLLVGGATTATSESLAVARLTATGAPDTMFGPDGKRAVGHPQWPNAVVSVSAAAVQKDGKILVGGSCRNCPSGADPSDNPFVARLLANGRIDSTFGAGGWAVGPWLVPEPGLDPHVYDSVSQLAVDRVGRILVQVYSHDMTGSVHVARLSSVGALDLSWSGDGVAPFAHDPVYWPTALGVDPASNEVYVAYDVLGETRIRRLTAEGAPDSSFAYYGVYSLEFGVSVSELLVDSAGRLVAAGSVYTESFWLTRILANGTLDASFGSSGTTEVEFNLTSGGDDVGRAAAFSGSKLVTVGAAETSSGSRVFAILRTE